ncbi:MAG TPA: hypothetical protein DCF33_07430 [Saprospirales bacterium]|nr:hypothetical protein [Saprospirales bacterium]
MKTTQLVPFLLLVVMSLSSCLTIVEEITIRKDGSGSYRIAMDGSKVKEMFGDIANKMGTDSQKDSTRAEVPADTISDVEKEEKKYMLTARLLSEKSGISNAIGFNDTTQFQSGYSFDFARLEDLQEAMISLEDEEAFGLWNDEASIELKGKTLKRSTGNSGFGDFLAEVMLKKSEDEGQDGAAVKNMMKMMFRDLEFKTVYHFPDQKIKKWNDKRATVSNDRHTLTLLEKPMDEKSKADKKPEALIIRLK